MNLDDLLAGRESSAWARFLGTHLPPRTLDLRFDLLAPHRRGSRPLLAPDKLRRLLAESRDNISALLAAITNQARAVNRYQVSAGQRFALAEVCHAALAAAARNLVSDVVKDRGGIPEERHRGDLLNATAAALEALVISYQLVFAADYDRSRFWYVRVRRRVHFCAHRILDLIGMIQQIRALRYQSLGNTHWRVANTVFCVMMDCEQVEIPLQPSGSLIGTPRPRDSKSLQDLYCVLQVPWILDFLCWPEAHLPIVLDYCQSMKDGVRVSRAQGGTCGTGQALTRCYRDAGPMPGPIQDFGSAADGPGLLIDFRVLADQAKADFRELSKARATRNPFLLPRRFARVDPVLQLTFAHRMVQLTEPKSPDHAQAAAPPNRDDLRIHVGFAEIYAHLQVVFSQSSPQAAGRELPDLFAQRSAMLGEDHTATEESRWHVLEEQPGRLRLRTQETRFTNPIAIGSLLAYGNGEAGIRAPSIGKVMRIHRQVPGFVLVDVTQFASFARPVEVRLADPADSEGDHRVIAALLVHADDGGWGLLLPESERFWEHTRVMLSLGGNDTKLRLADLLDVVEGCCLFQLEARMKNGEHPQYPQREMSTQELAD